MNIVNLVIAMYTLLLLLYFAYHILCLKRTQVINEASRSRDVKLAMSKCYAYHIDSLKFVPVWPVKLIKDLYDIVKQYYESKEK